MVLEAGGPQARAPSDFFREGAPCCEEMQYEVGLASHTLRAKKKRRKGLVTVHTAIRLLGMQLLTATNHWLFS